MSLGSYGKNFPISDYYREHIVDAVTIKRSANWWTALLVIQDPRTNKPFIAIYRWEKRNGEWKKRNSMAWKNQTDLNQFKTALSFLESHLNEN